MVFKKENKKKIEDCINSIHSKYIEINPFYGSRTLRQNALYWAVLNEFSKDTGYTKDELHSYFSEKYIPIQKFVIFGEQIEVRKSTTKMNKVEFNEYLDKVMEYINIEAEACGDL